MKKFWFRWFARPYYWAMARYYWWQGLRFYTIGADELAHEYIIQYNKCEEKLWLISRWKGED